MSQNFDIGLSFILMSKNGKIFKKKFDYFSTFHRIKTRTYIKHLRHRSLQMDVFYGCLKFLVWEMIIKRNILSK